MKTPWCLQCFKWLHCHSFRMCVKTSHQSILHYFSLEWVLAIDHFSDGYSKPICWFSSILWDQDVWLSFVCKIGLIFYASYLLCFVIGLQGLPQVLLFRVQFLKEALLLPALSNRDEKVISGLACLMSEIGQAVCSLFFLFLFCIEREIYTYSPMCFHY